MTTKQRNEVSRLFERIMESSKGGRDLVKDIPSFGNTNMLIANLAKIESELDFIVGELDKMQ